MGFFASDDKYRAGRVLKQADSVLGTLRSLAEKKELYEENVRTAADALRQQKAAQLLASTDIEEINFNKVGIRVSALRKAGIEKVWKLFRMEDYRLMAINGIGETMLQNIRRNQQLLWKDAMRNAPVELAPTAPNAHSTAIVKSIYLLDKERPVMRRALELFQKYYEAIQSDCLMAEKATSNLAWMFSSKQMKQEIAMAVDRLEWLLNAELGKETAELAEIDRRLTAVGEEQAWGAYLENSAPFYAMLESLVGTAAVSYAGSGMPEALVRSVEAFPLDVSELRVTLRHYQDFGVRYILHQKRVLLGDEMGLGKTVQAIGAMAHLKAMGKTHFLVVCPLSVLVNWQREVEKHSNLYTTCIYSDDRDLELQRWCLTGGVGITTYETLSRITWEQEQPLDMLVVDEAVYVKNEDAQRTQQVLALVERAEHVLYMTGTPMENRVEEMCYLIGCLQPEMRGKIAGIRTMAEAPRFRETVAPVYLRRRRDDVLKELPTLMEKEQWGTMTEPEHAAYVEALRGGNFMEVRQLSWHTPGDPAVVSTKAKRLLELCNTARENGEKVLVFSFFKDTLQKVAAILSERVTGVIDGSVASGERQKTIDAFGKAEAGAVLVCQVQAGGVGLNMQMASVVIFCEPQMKPSLEEQAIARAYRMGQTKPVSVHRLLMTDTVDEKMQAMLQRKQKSFDTFADQSVTGEISTEMCKAMLKQECERLGITEDAPEVKSVAPESVEDTQTDNMAESSERSGADESDAGGISPEELA